VRFTAQGRDAGTYRFTGAQLVADNWVITVPEDVASSLRASGAPPTPDF
jgi:hypothetical protein